MPLLPFNSHDVESNVNRISCSGRYDIVDLVPLNPKGRTGLRGRGVLPHWGPNHIALLVITRSLQRTPALLICNILDSCTILPLDLTAASRVLILIVSIAGGRHISI